MPWKGAKDPYKIWLSEIILQQTRVAQGLPYYEKFIQNFPTIFDLANAEDQFVFKLWEGLGYYNRCRNLLFTARYIVENYDGIFPKNYEQIIELKGIGPYTAAAIASFAFQLPYAVLDGNVYRVLSRYFGIETPSDSPEGEKIFAKLAQDNLDKKKPGVYNQAIMDFGATICLPAIPKCNQCILSKDCTALALGLINKLPIKEKILKKKTRYFTWFVFRVNDQIFIQQRRAKDIWENLYEFFLVESEGKPNWENKSVNEWLENQFKQHPKELEISPVLSQQLTHQKIFAQFIQISLDRMPVQLPKANWLNIKNLTHFGFPKLCKEFIEQNF
ncbi:A/G-specific adenine glycosylase [Rhizosphaericola mali]|nr:A/G-specific adenine glycosylase [Rhizosphaericola mali]